MFPFCALRLKYIWLTELTQFFLRLGDALVGESAQNRKKLRDVQKTWHSDEIAAEAIEILLHCDGKRRQKVSKAASLRIRHEDFTIQGLTKANQPTRTRLLPSGRQSELRIPKRWLGGNKRHSRSCPLEQPVLWASGFVRCEIPEPDSASVRGHV